MDTSRKITQIPFPGGSGNVPTGAMQFQDDWPGLFLRGDNTIAVRSSIRGLQQRLSDHPDTVVQLALSHLGQIAEVIEKDVLARGGQPRVRPLE